MSQVAWVATIQERIALEALHILREITHEIDLGRSGRIRISGYAHDTPPSPPIGSDDTWVKRRTDVAEMLVARGVLRLAQAQYVGGSPYVAPNDAGCWLTVEGDEQTARNALHSLEDRFSPKSSQRSAVVPRQELPKSIAVGDPVETEVENTHKVEQARLPYVILAGVAVPLIVGLLAFFLTPVGDWIRVNWFSKSISFDRYTSATLLADLMEGAPRARWSSGHVNLAWPGSAEDTTGYARWVDNASLEDGTQRPRVLQTHPEWIPEGKIMGEFSLDRPLRPGDVFYSEVGFLRGWAGQVEFIVETFGGNRPGERTVGTMWDRGEDRQVKKLAFDLTPSEGDRVIRLVVRAGQASFQDWAVWINPRIERR